MGNYMQEVGLVCGILCTIFNFSVNLKLYLKIKSVNYKRKNETIKKIWDNSSKTLEKSCVTQNCKKHKTDKFNYMKTKNF